MIIYLGSLIALELSVKGGRNYEVQKSTLFTLDKEAFFDEFINYRQRVALEQDVFSMRSQGLVSYYESYDPRSFPVHHELTVVKVPMQKIQFGQYITVREKEVAKEQKAASFNKGKQDGVDRDMKSGNVYRAFSRAMCNFVFPEEIKRPYPSTTTLFKSEIDEADEDADFGLEKAEEKKTTAAKLKIVEYNRLVAVALAQLKEKADKYLSAEGLAEYGPKIKAILDRIESCPGSALVYSSFRNVEGIKIISMALDYAGYSELKVKKEKGIR